MPDTQTQLAGTTVPCPQCDGGRKRIEGTNQKILCLTCNCEGRVHVFPDEVRVPCNRLKADLAPCPEDCQSNHDTIEQLHLHSGPGHHVNPCSKCDSRGWIAATDVGTWIQAFHGAGIGMSIDNYDSNGDPCPTFDIAIRDVLGCGPKFEPMFFETGLRAVQQIPGVEVPDHD